jgi:hypothetical protein
VVGNDKYEMKDLQRKLDDKAAKNNNEGEQATRHGICQLELGTEMRDQLMYDRFCSILIYEDDLKTCCKSGCRFKSFWYRS